MTMLCTPLISSRPHRWGGLLALVLCLCTAPAQAQSIVPEGPEFQANTYTVGDQLNPAVATNEQGRRVVVWQSGLAYGSGPTQDGFGAGIYAQVYDAAGAPVGGEFRVNDYTPGHQSSPDVAMAADGRFTVVWDSGGQDGSGLGVVARRFAPDGTRLGTEFLVNTTRAGSQSIRSVSMDAAGNEIVIWHSQQQGGAYAQRYDTAGGFIGGEFRVSPESDLTSPKVTLLSDGGFMVVGLSQSGPQNSIVTVVQAVRYGSDGLLAGPPVRVDETPPSTVNGPKVRAPDVAARTGAGFVVTWEGPSYTGNLIDVYARSYNASGTPTSGEFVASTTRPVVLVQANPTVAMNDLGQFAIAWTTFSADGQYLDVRGRFFDATGVARGDDLRLNPTDAGTQDDVEIAMNVSGFVATWSGRGNPPPQDGDGKGVFGQQFRTAPVAAEPGVTPELTLALAPNPVGRAGGSVRIALQAAGPVRLSVIDTLGREVAVLVDGPLPAGEQTVTLDTAALPAGVYVVRLTAGSTAVTQRLVVAR